MSGFPLRRWFELTREEQRWIAAILAIFLVGLVARWYHAARDPAPPAADARPE